MLLSVRPSPASGDLQVGRCQSVLVWLIAAFLATAGLLKLIWPANGDRLHLAIGILELVAAGLVLRREWRLKVSYALVAFSVVGAARAMLVRAPCGCLGKLVQLEWGVQLLLCGLLGLLAVMVAAGESVRRMSGRANGL